MSLFQPFRAISAFFERKERRLFLWAIALATLLHHAVQTFGNEAFILSALATFLVPPLILACLITLLCWKLSGWPLFKQLCLWSGRATTLTLLYIVITPIAAMYAPNGYFPLTKNCEKIIPNLESYRQAKGGYPHDLEALAKFEPLPEGFEIVDCPYFKRGRTFGIVINEFWDDYAYYDRETQTWE